jgi:hypothetical protein
MKALRLVAFLFVFAVLSTFVAVYLGLQQWIAALILLGFICILRPLRGKPLDIIRELNNEVQRDDKS